jgi:hypothetical protein
LLTALLTSDPAGVLRRLRASNAEIARAQAIAAGPVEPADEDPAAVRQWLAKVGGAADDLIALYRLRRGRDPSWLGAVTTSRERGDPLSRGDLAITGKDLEALGLSGKRIGEALATLLDRVLEDPALNTREQLLAIVRERR